MNKTEISGLVKVFLRVTILIIVIVIISAIIAQGAVLFGSGIVGLIGIPFALFAIYSFRYGMVILFLFGSFMFVIDRLLLLNLPLGILFDLLILFMFSSIMISSKFGKKFDFKLNEPITILNLLFFAYFALEILNPNASSFVAWFVSVRFYTLLLLYFILIAYFDRSVYIKTFIYLWLAIGLIVAFYGLQQEFFGLRDFEWNYIHAVPERFVRYFNWGHLRVFSILSDPAAFGLFMAFSGLATLILAFGPFGIGTKIFYGISTLIIFVSMTYSGTRTAFAMVVVGVAFFIVLNIKNAKVLAGSMILVLAFLVLMVGPFYSGPVLRLRSTFNFSNDPSMGVRDNTRMMFQKYIQTHPIGGGVNTSGNFGATYSPGHPLAGYPPDSGYLKTALELGWLGLALVLAFNFAVVYKGIRNHYSIRSEILKAYNLAFLIPFFGLTIANYAQDAMFQKPIMLPVIATYALMVKLIDIDKQDQTS